MAGEPASSIERIALEMASSLKLPHVLSTVTQGLVDDLGAAFARIWLLGPGDLCQVCHKASVCKSRERCLHLQASAGIYTNLDGEYRRVPLGALKIGLIATDGKPVVTNNVLGDDRIPNKTWLRENGFVAFAGYPLRYGDELLGVLAIFRRRPFEAPEMDRLALFANQASVAIQNAKLFEEVESLKDRLQEENLYLRQEIQSGHDFEEIVGESGPLTSVLDEVRQVAPTDATVLVLGETGTGKELFARAIHDRSKRRDRPLIKVNCAALPGGLIESELFGHEKGAFTGALQRRAGRFELAHRGTLFLDEIGDLALELQAKLLRVLQEGEFERVGGTESIKADVRLIAATHQPLARLVEDGRFRADLFYRLNVFPLRLPPLRERSEDIPLLAGYFVEKHGSRVGKKLRTIGKETLGRLAAYAWPGNIRELENVIERAVILARDETLRIDDELLPATRTKVPSEDLSLEAMERRHVTAALDSADWKIEGPDGAATKLDMRPSTLRSLMKRLGVERT
jgi:transcriptional regulator with GAF, ATPase, and Fis domain